MSDLYRCVRPTQIKYSADKHIAYGKPCQGTEVREGRCMSCWGIPGVSGTRRKCCWLDVANNVHTYEQAQNFRALTRIPQNTVAGRSLRQGQVDDDVDDLDFTDIATNSPERRLLGQMIMRRLARSGIVDIATNNYDSLLELTEEAWDILVQRGEDESGFLVAADVIEGILVGMRRRNQPFGKVEVLVLLQGVDTYTDNVFRV